MTTQHTDDFYAKIDADPDAVYIVEEYVQFERRGLAVFSTKEKAQEYCDSRDGDTSCVVCPFVIDEPDFGNARKQ